MKTNLSIIQLLFTACIVFSCSEMKENEDFSADTLSIDTKAVKDSPVFSAYDYCNKDGFWGKFKSLEERFDAIQLPPAKLDYYSTEELLILCLNSPLNNIHTAYNNELDGVNLLAENLNVFSAFEEREDAASVLVDFYSRIIIDQEQSTSCVFKDGKFTMSIFGCNFLELYIASFLGAAAIRQQSRCLQIRATQFPFLYLLLEHFFWKLTTR